MRKIWKRRIYPTRKNETGNVNAAHLPRRHASHSIKPQFHLLITHIYGDDFLFHRYCTLWLQPQARYSCFSLGVTYLGPDAELLKILPCFGRNTFGCIWSLLPYPNRFWSGFLYKKTGFQVRMFSTGIDNCVYESINRFPDSFYSFKESQAGPGKSACTRVFSSVFRLRLSCTPADFPFRKAVAGFRIFELRANSTLF